MSKMRAMFFGMVAAIMGHPTMTASQKQVEAKSINKMSGGAVFGGSPYGPSRVLNQRQKRKRNRQTQNFK